MLAVAAWFLFRERQDGSGQSSIIIASQASKTSATPVPATPSVQTPLHGSDVANSGDSEVDKGGVNGWLKAHDSGVRFLLDSAV